MTAFNEDHTARAEPDPLPYPEIPILEAKAILAAQEVAGSPHDRNLGAELNRILARLLPAELATLGRAAVLLADHCGYVAGRQNSIVGTVHGQVVQATDIGRVDLRG